MADHDLFQSQHSQQGVTAVSQPLQAGFAEDNPYSIWENIQRHPHYSEYRNQVKACVSIHDSAFAHYSALLMDPHASQFIEAVSLSVQYAPPMNMWNDIIRLRCHPKFSTVRSIILANMEKMSVNHSRNPRSARSSDSSYRSAANLSIRTGNSSRCSGVSSNTDSFVHFEGDHNVMHQGTPVPVMVDYDYPDPPSIVTSARGQRRAPEGKCFICPSKECSGKGFRRVGDWTNHIERVHGITPWHNPSKWLRDDPRPRPSQPTIESPAPEAATRMLRSDIEPATKREFKMDEHQARNTVHTQARSVDNPIYGHETFVPLDTTLHRTGHYGNTGVATLYSDMIFQPINENQPLSFFDDGDDMET